MKSYTNKSGDKVTVSKEHLDTAVRIKLELQKASPSRRASLKLLVDLMEKEGFFDAEASESYRCMLKAYQKSIGKLDKVETYADKVANSKLESIKELVGELAYEKRETQHYLREINKGKRELIDFSILVEEIRQAIEEHDFSELKNEYLMYDVPVSRAGTRAMIACLSDMHVGALVDTDINTYNYEVAQRRLGQYLARLIKECKEKGITDVYVVNLGDVVEHASMRFSQGFNAEFTFSQQIVKASDLIIKFLRELAKHVNVTYSGIAGNHDRITDKDKNIDGDHAVNAINAIIETFIENAEIPTIDYVQADDYAHSFGINGASFKFVHGDLDSWKNENLVAKHSELDGVLYDAVVMGHFHHFRDMEVGYMIKIILFGSLKGADEYGKKIRKISVASQGFIIVEPDGRFQATQVILD